MYEYGNSCTDSKSGLNTSQDNVEAPPPPVGWPIGRLGELLRTCKSWGLLAASADWAGWTIYHRQLYHWGVWAGNGSVLF